MQRAVRRVLDDERGGGAPLGLRVGLNTGDGGRRASRPAIEYTVIGDTVNTAARLADAAAIGAVYAGTGTAAATRHVASWRQLRPLRLKGKRDAGRGVRAARPARRARAPGPGWATRRRSSAARPSSAGSPAGWPRSSTGASRGCWCSPPRPGSARPGSPPRWSGSRPATTWRWGVHPRAGARVLSVRCARVRRAPPAGAAGRPGPRRDRPAGRAATVTRAVVEERLRRLASAGSWRRDRRGRRRRRTPTCCSRCSATPSRSTRPGPTGGAATAAGPRGRPGDARPSPPRSPTCSPRWPGDAAAW